ncbi:MAG TPA: hypothetical protein VFH48_27470 [Chloroflexota bacterium]|nr:hypothetical protein [Chloroflexota bacterium]
MSMLDPEAAQLLRRAIQLGDPGRTTVKDLRLAVEHPVPIELPPSRLRGDAPLAQLLRRAMEIARTQSRETVSRADLIEALVEAEAVAAGLDLDRLRFARFCVERAHAETRPALRRVGEGVTAPSDGSSA